MSFDIVSARISVDKNIDKRMKEVEEKYAGLLKDIHRKLSALTDRESYVRVEVFPEAVDDLRFYFGNSGVRVSINAMQFSTKYVVLVYLYN